MSLFSRTVYRVIKGIGYEIMRSGDYRELADSLARFEKEKRHLMAQIAGSPEVDYQIVMEYHEKKAAFRDADRAFYAAYQRVAPFTMTSIERLYAMYKAVEYLVKAAIPGDIVESGVWRGGNMMLAALVLRNLGDTRRRLWLYDTFEGLPKPDPKKDVDMWGNPQFDEWVKYRRTDEASTMADASLEEVRRNLESTGYPVDKVELVKGMVQRTIPAHAPAEIALLRLDTDWYDSTVCELRHLYPRVVDGGVLIIDDYGHLLGQRQAVDEYFAASVAFPLLHRIDYSGRLVVKQSRNSNVAASRGSRSLVHPDCPQPDAAASAAMADSAVGGLSR